jgi:lysyl-tRNA synthetase class I
MSEEEKDTIIKLKNELADFGNKNIEELNTIVYSIVKDDSLEMKEQIKVQKEFFKLIYNLLIGKNAGPRLSTFL